MRRVIDLKWKPSEDFLKKEKKRYFKKGGTVTTLCIDEETDVHRPLSWNDHILEIPVITKMHSNKVYRE